MGANPTQASAIALFFTAMICIAASFALELNWMLMIVGLLILGGAIGVFRKCKPWEHSTD